jgi:hypothetical protein
MIINRIQLQPGMSLPEFLRCFGTEAHCSAALMVASWPAGFHCPRCSSDAHCVVGHGTRRRFQFNGCRHQTSLTAGSLMERTKLPLTTWSLAIYLISQAKTGLSAQIQSVEANATSCSGVTVANRHLDPPIVVALQQHLKRFRIDGFNDG